MTCVTVTPKQTCIHVSCPYTFAHVHIYTIIYGILQGNTCMYRYMLLLCVTDQFMKYTCEDGDGDGVPTIILRSALAPQCFVGFDNPPTGPWVTLMEVSYVGSLSGAVQESIDGSGGVEQSKHRGWGQRSLSLCRSDEDGQGNNCIRKWRKIS